MKDSFVLFRNVRRRILMELLLGFLSVHHSPSLYGFIGQRLEVPDEDVDERVSPRRPQALAEYLAITAPLHHPPSDVLPSHLAPFSLSDTVDARPDAPANRRADNDLYPRQKFTTRLVGVGRAARDRTEEGLC